MLLAKIEEPKGKRVKIPHGPATVIGEPPAAIHWRQGRWEGGRGGRAISQETCPEVFPRTSSRSERKGKGFFALRTSPKGSEGFLLSLPPSIPLTRRESGRKNGVVRRIAAAGKPENRCRRSRYPSLPLVFPGCGAFDGFPGRLLA